MKIFFDFRFFLCTLTALLLLVGCEKDGPGNHIPHITILYSAGANNLGDSMDENIKDFSANYLPTRYENNKVLVVSQRRSSSHHLEAAQIFMLYRDDNTGAVKKESVVTMPSSLNIADTDGYIGIMKYISRNHPGARYTMIISSHGTGWLPACYSTSESWTLSSFKSVGDSDVRDPESGITCRTSIEVTEMASRSPIHFDCIVFDACLMGGIEVAYELRNITDRIVFSSAEINIRGFDYDSCLRRLLAYDKPDYEGLCLDFIQKYKGNTDALTISMVECDALSSLAELCRDLFSRYDFARTRYVYDYYNYCFTDIYSLAQSSGLSSPDLESLTAQLKKCVPYRYYSNLYLSQEEFYGLSMFNPYYSYKNLIPYSGTSLEVKNIGTYYKTLEWNKATGLVK